MCSLHPCQTLLSEWMEEWVEMLRYSLYSSSLRPEHGQTPGMCTVGTQTRDYPPLVADIGFNISQQTQVLTLLPTTRLSHQHKAGPGGAILELLFWQLAMYQVAAKWLVNSLFFDQNIFVSFSPNTLTMNILLMLYKAFVLSFVDSVQIPTLI